MGSYSLSWIRGEIRRLNETLRLDEVESQRRQQLRRRSFGVRSACMSLSSKLAYFWIFLIFF